MKKIIGIFAILVLGMGVFGQAFIRSHSFIEVRERFLSGEFDALTLAERISKYHLSNDYDWIGYVHFIEDGRLYLLSYEPVPNINAMNMSRSIYLYSNDIDDINSPWELASDVVLTCKFVDCKNYTNVDLYLYDENHHNTSVGEVNAIGDVREIIISEYRKKDGWIVSDNKLKITLTPNPLRTNFYTIK